MDGNKIRSKGEWHAPNLICGCFGSGGKRAKTSPRLLSNVYQAFPLIMDGPNGSQAGYVHSSSLAGFSFFHFEGFLLSAAVTKQFTEFCVYLLLTNKGIIAR
uniref:Uncharacterized protein n=1 Tax=Rhizophora mucronata TaxID=61149 RepID=A0A2P2JP10_RHIMU